MFDMYFFKPSLLNAIEVAPKISDREIIEGLAIFVGISKRFRPISVDWKKGRKILRNGRC